jgi:hypothetical protein
MAEDKRLLQKIADLVGGHETVKITEAEILASLSPELRCILAFASASRAGSSTSDARRRLLENLANPGTAKNRTPQGPT